MGPFHLSALFLRKGTFDKWDLLGSAPKINKDNIKALKYITSEIRKTLSSIGTLKLTSVGILDDDYRALHSFQRQERFLMDQLAIQDCIVFGVEIKRAFILTSQRSVKKTV